MADTTTTPSSQLTVTVEQPSSFARRLSITVPKEQVERVRRSVAQQVTRNVRVPGFRKGHIPQNILDKQFGAAIQQETVDRVIQETYPRALEQENVRPIAQGQVQDVHYHDGGDLHYHVDVEVQPAIELARTSGFVVARPTDEVTDADVDGVLERLRTERAQLVTVDDRTPDVGDEVQVRITPAAAPAEGDDAPEAEEFKFVLGEGQAIPAIEAAIQTLQPGEEGEFDIEFPEDYGDAEQAGTTQRLRIGVVELKARTFPELDDDFARALGNGEFESMAALRERLHGDLGAEARQRADQGYRDALLGQIVEANNLEVPPSMVENYLDYMTSGMTGGQRGKKAARTPEQEERFSQFREMLRPQAETTLKRMLVVETLADREGLRATQDEVDARVEEIAEQHGRSPSDVWLELEKGGQLQGMEADITEGKVIEWLRSHNTDA